VNFLKQPDLSPQEAGQVVRLAKGLDAIAVPKIHLIWTKLPLRDIDTTKSFKNRHPQVLFEGAC
jgi:hypothetical protein